MAVLLETPFDPQALFTALNYVSNVFNATSWQNLLKLFFMIALINGIISVGIYRKTDYIKQFIIALGLAGVLAYPVNDNLAIKRADTERVYTINNSKAPFILVEGIRVVNLVTKWFTSMAGASINSPNYTGMYDAGIGSNANIIRNSIDMAIPDPKVKADLVQFIKECTLYDIRDGAVSMHDLVNKGNGFDLIFNNTSPARFVSINSITGNPEVKTCHDAAQVLKTQINTEAQKVLTGKAAMFFYQKDVAPLVVYSTAVQSSYQAQLNINSNVSQIAKQNMFNHLLEVSGEDIGKLLNDPSMAESAAIHMGVARAAKKAAFQQSIVAQLGKEILPAMSSWFAIIIIMLFPFVVLIFVITQFNNMWQILAGYMGTLFWICCWQPIFAIINGLANWELGRQLAKTGAFRQEGIPYGFVTPVYDTLLSNHSMVGWMVMLTPIIAGMVVYGTYRGFSHLGNSIFSTFSGASSAVGNEMSDGNLNMGNTNFGNSSLGNLTQNTTSANKYGTSPSINSGEYNLNSADGINYSVWRDGNLSRIIANDSILGEHRTSTTASVTTGNNYATSNRFGASSSTSLNQTGFAVEQSTASNMNSVTHTDEKIKSNSTINSSDTGHTTENGWRSSQATVINQDTYKDDSMNAEQRNSVDDYRNTGTTKGWSATASAAATATVGGRIEASKGVSILGNGAKGTVYGDLNVSGRLEAEGHYRKDTATGQNISNVDSQTSSQTSGTRTSVTMVTDSGAVGSSISHHTTGVRSESGNTRNTIDSTSNVQEKGNNHAEGTEVQLSKNTGVEREIEQTIGSNMNTGQTYTITSEHNLGLAGRHDTGADWVYKNHPDLFKNEVSNYLSGDYSTPEDAWGAYQLTSGLSKMNMRDHFSALHVAIEQDNVSQKTPDDSQLPNSTKQLDERFNMHGGTIRDAGNTALNTIKTNYQKRPK